MKKIQSKIIIKLKILNHSRRKAWGIDDKGQIKKTRKRKKSYCREQSVPNSIGLRPRLLLSRSAEPTDFSISARENTAGRLVEAVAETGMEGGAR